MMFRFLSLVSVATLAAAQLSGLSQQCTGALTSVATNPAASACLSTSSLIPIISGLGSNSSIITPLNNFFTNICAAPVCSNDTLGAVVQNITAGCGTELAGLGFTSDLTPSVVAIVQQFYPTVRKVICLKDGDANCVTQTLTNIQNVSGDLTSLSTLTGLLGNGLDNLPANITCTNCVKAAYNIVSADIPMVNPSTANFLSGKCGASFTDGQTPSSIVQSASTGTGTKPPTGGALGLRSPLASGVTVGLGVSALLVISSAFTLLA